MNIKGSQTEINLLKAFAGESQARNRYTYFASAARKEGLEQIAAVFEETANQEKEHAKRFFQFLEGGEVEITATFPAGQIAKAIDNLQAAADGEHEEWSALYPAFAATARQEGFEAIGRVFEAIGVAERNHESRYRQFRSTLASGEAFARNQAVTWYCRNCGYLHDGMEAPKACPACAHPQAYFQAL